MKNKNLPDFLIIGAGKSGTTSLDNYLKQHPQIFISPVKEPNFFSYYKSDINLEEEDADFVAHYNNSVTNLDDYHALFSKAEENQIKGETSNTYLYSQFSVDNLLKLVPEVKLVAIFRQPTERLYSRYLHLARDNRLPKEKFEDILTERNSIWWKRPDLIQEGFYFKHLSKFYESFPKENIKVFLFNDLKSNPNLVFNNLFSFLNVDDKFEPNIDILYNKSGFIKNRFINNLVGANSIWVKSAKNLSPKIYNSLKNNHLIFKAINTLRSNNLKRPKLDQELKQEITNNVYKEDILNLQDLIERDLSKWLS